MKKEIQFLVALIMILCYSQINAQVEFIAHTIASNMDGAYSVYAIDVDGDSDIDVLSASYWDNTIAWYENDGNQNFTTHIVTASADGACSVYAIDVDSDSDIDVLSASYDDNKIVWYENDGSQNFTTHTITTSANGARSVYAIDLDGDNDVDVLSASGNDNKITWYENQIITGIVDNNPTQSPDEFRLYNNYPNPFNPTTHIEFDVKRNLHVILKAYDLLGHEVATLLDQQLQPGHYKTNFNAKDLQTGVYFYNIRMGEFQETKKMVLIQ